MHKFIIEKDLDKYQIINIEIYSANGIKTRGPSGPYIAHLSTFLLQIVKDNK